MDMISLPIEFDKQLIEGRYRLVNAVSIRARALYQGATPLVISKGRKITTVALEEIVSDRLRILTGEAAIEAKKESESLTYKDMMDEAQQKETLPEDLTELEKDLKVYLHEKEEMESKKAIDEIFPENEKGSS